MEDTYYDGTGGYEGEPAIAGIMKPMTCGRCQRIPPILINREKNIWQVHGNGRIEKFEAIYHEGRKINIIDDYDDLFNPVADAWVELSSSYRDKSALIDCANGAFRLNFIPTGMILCDAIGPSIYRCPDLSELQERWLQATPQ